jgi:hypothetical protein
MATQNDFTRSFRPAAAMSAYRRVLVDTSGYINYAGNTVVGQGVLQNDVTADSFASGTVRFFGTGSCRISVTAGPATLGDKLYAAANGQVSATGTVVVGMLIDATTAQGSEGEVIPGLTL